MGCAYLFQYTVNTHKKIKKANYYRNKKEIKVFSQPVCFPTFSLLFLYLQLSQLRGRDKNFTLLHALLEQIMLQEPGLATFTQDLAEFETVPGGICSSRFDQNSRRKKNLWGAFELKAVKWNIHLYLIPLLVFFSPSSLESFHQRLDRRSGW